MAARAETRATVAVPRAGVAGGMARRAEGSAFPGGAGTTAASRIRAAGLIVGNARGCGAISAHAAQAAALGGRSACGSGWRASSDARRAGMGGGVAKLRTAVSAGLTDIGEPMAVEGGYDRAAAAASRAPIGCAASPGPRCRPARGSSGIATSAGPGASVPARGARATPGLARIGAAIAEVPADIARFGASTRDGESNGDRAQGGKAKTGHLGTSRGVETAGRPWCRGGDPGGGKSGGRESSPPLRGGSPGILMIRTKSDRRFR